MRACERACDPGKTLLMWPIAMSRESVPCGCQQPPKSTANLSVASMWLLGRLPLAKLLVWLRVVQTSRVGDALNI